MLLAAVESGNYNTLTAGLVPLLRSMLQSRVTLRTLSLTKAANVFCSWSVQSSDAPVSTTALPDTVAGGLMEEIPEYQKDNHRAD